jgi:DNA-binding NtrC family response regulator
MGRPISSINSDAVARLDAYDWPGNIRELRNVIERAVILCRTDRIEVGDLPRELNRGKLGTPAWQGAFMLPEAGIDLAALERDLVLQALERCSGNQSKAARLLGIGRYALRYRMDKMGLLKTDASDKKPRERRS